MWPKPPVNMPVDADDRADYFDSMYHSVTVVGLNTTAMIEAAIVGRSVHTLLFPEYEDTQGATFHFDYLFTVGGGILRPARSFEEHEDQLAAVLAGTTSRRTTSRSASSASSSGPYGLDVAATPRFVEEVERLGAAQTRRTAAKADLALSAARRRYRGRLRGAAARARARVPGSAARRGGRACTSSSRRRRRSR